MGLITKSVQNFTNPDNPATGLLSANFFQGLDSGGPTKAGPSVNEKTAMAFATVYACIRRVSADLSSAPLKTYKVGKDGSYNEDLSLPEGQLIRVQANPGFMPAKVARQAAIIGLLGWGNGYMIIQRNGRGVPVGLYPIPSSKMKVVNRNGIMSYACTHTSDNSTEYFNPADVLHFREMSYDGWNGLSPIQQLRESIGLGIAQDNALAKLYAQGLMTTGVFTTEGVLDDEPYEKAKKQVESWASGNSIYKPLLLEGGMKFQTNMISPSDAQTIEGREWTTSQICGAFGVDPHLIGDLAHATYSNVGNALLEYAILTLKTHAESFEQEINLKLMPEGYVCHHDLDAVMLADPATKVQYLSALRNVGYLTTNDGLRKLRMNPISKAEGGDVRIVPLNFVNLKSLVNVDAGNEIQPTPGKPAQAPAQPAKNQVSATYLPLVQDALNRVLSTSYDSKRAYRAFFPTVKSLTELLEMPEEKALSVTLAVAAKCSEWANESPESVFSFIFTELSNAKNSNQE